MRQIYKRLYISSDRGCFMGEDEWAVIHACRAPCYMDAVDSAGSGVGLTPHAFEEGKNLYLDILDPVEPRFDLEVFTTSLEFMHRHWGKGRKILVHCNAGLSRSPSIALLFLAKHLAAISDRSYEAARADYQALDPRYSPGSGIQSYLMDQWAEIS